MMLGLNEIRYSSMNMKFLYSKAGVLTACNIKAILKQLHRNGGDRLRQESCTSSECMPGSFMQLVKKCGEKTIANNQELALAA